MNEMLTAAVEESAPVVQVIETYDYSDLLTGIYDEILSLQEIMGYIEGFLIFFSVVALCYFSYRFLRIFF